MRSIDELGQESQNEAQEKFGLETLRFGRRVVFDKQLTNKELLETHLNSVRES